MKTLNPFFLVIISFFVMHSTYAVYPKDIESLAYLWFIKAFPTEEFHPEPVSISTEEKEFYKNIVTNLVRSEYGFELLEAANKLKFQFAGFTKTASKANTDTAKRLIRIREDLSIETATLSFAYELSNLINIFRYRSIMEDVHYKKFNADDYAKEILKLESEAVLRRSIVAIQLNLGHLIENQHYFDIASRSPLSSERKLEMIFFVLKKMGKVGRNRIPVFEYYKSQYLEIFQ